jgi:hypothetical protein
MEVRVRQGITEQVAQSETVPVVVMIVEPSLGVPEVAQILIHGVIMEAQEVPVVLPVEMLVA